MTTNELIRALRENPAFGEQGDLMLMAADRLQELDDLVALISENEVQAPMDDIFWGGA